MAVFLKNMSRSAFHSKKVHLVPNRLNSDVVFCKIMFIGENDVRN